METFITAQKYSFLELNYKQDCEALNVPTAFQDPWRSNNIENKYLNLKKKHKIEGEKIIKRFFSK